MYALMIVFIIVALLISLFSAGVVGRDIYIEEKQRRQAKREKAAVTEPAAATASATATIVAAIPVQIPAQTAQSERTVQSEQVGNKEITSSVAAAEVSAYGENASSPEGSQAEGLWQEVESQAAATVFEEDSEGSGTVAFSAVSQTLDEKYLDLCPEYKGYYDEIVRSAMAVEGSKRYKNSAYEEYKVGKNRLVRLKIRRGVVTCEFVIANLAFKNYAKDSKVAIKQAPARIKVIDEASLNAVKDSIGIAVQAINEEKEFKKEQARQRRRQNRAAAKLAESSVLKAE